MRTITGTLLYNKRWNKAQVSIVENALLGLPNSSHRTQAFETIVSTLSEAKPTTNDWAKPCSLFHLLLYLNGVESTFELTLLDFLLALCFTTFTPHHDLLAVSPLLWARVSEPSLPLVLAQSFYAATQLSPASFNSISWM